MSRRNLHARRRAQNAADPAELPPAVLAILAYVERQPTQDAQRTACLDLRRALVRMKKADGARRALEARP